MYTEGELTTEECIPEDTGTEGTLEGGMQRTPYLEERYIRTMFATSGAVECGLMGCTLVRMNYVMVKMGDLQMLFCYPEGLKLGRQGFDPKNLNHCGLAGMGHKPPNVAILKYKICLLIYF